jgi:hypothetical protein
VCCCPFLLHALVGKAKDVVLVAQVQVDLPSEFNEASRRVRAADNLKQNLRAPSDLANVLGVLVLFMAQSRQIGQAATRPPAIPIAPIRLVLEARIADHLLLVVSAQVLRALPHLPRPD